MVWKILKGRKQFTSVNGVCSKTSVIGCGVPQGSVLGPLLFLLYVNNIQNAFTSATPKLFADDISIFLFGKDLKGLFSTANTELASLSEWLLANKLTLSIGQDKDTKFTLFANKQALNLPKLSFQGHEVLFTSTIKYFGVHLDNKFTFKEHVAKICKKIKRICRNILPRTTPFTTKMSTSTLLFFYLQLPLLLRWSLQKRVKYLYQTTSTYPKPGTSSPAI